MFAGLAQIGRTLFVTSHDAMIDHRQHPWSRDARYFQLEFTQHDATVIEAASTTVKR